MRADVVGGSETLERDAVVIGAGPAGLAVANRLAASGLQTVLVDENQRPGGQIWRQTFKARARAAEHRLRDAPAAVRLHPTIEFWGDSTCHGFADGTAVVTTGGQLRTVRSRAAVVATGALEYVLPVPGWTLPGVITAGAAQSYLKGSQYFPFRRVVVAGSGPILLASASQLVERGVDVAGVFEAVSPRTVRSRTLVRLGAEPKVLREGLHYLRVLRRAGVRVRFGTGVTSIHGETSVGATVVERLGKSAEKSATADTLECDAVVLSHGFTSNFELAAQAGADIVWDAQRSTWSPWRDRQFNTTIPGLVTVGDCSGVGGVQVATLEGEIAGLHLVARLSGGSADRSEVVALRRRLQRLERFRAGMDSLYRPPDLPLDRRAGDPCICRCQGTRLSEVIEAAANGIGDVRGVKLWTRAGMGMCQGRVCEPTVRRLLRSAGLEPTAPPSVRFPVRPLPMGVFDSYPIRRVQG